MFIKKFILSVFLCCISFINFNLYSDVSSELQLASVLEGFEIFQGDKHGDFQGDLVAILRDRSAWKIHPDDQEKVSGWQLGESVHISLRTSFYWFKREHKFMLCNDDKGESAKVMIVRHAEPSLQIQSASDVHPTSMIEVEEYIGNDFKGCPIFEEEMIPANFKKEIFLNNGSEWVIEERFDEFCPETMVYMGVKETEEETRKFLISGVEREAVWTWVKPFGDDDNE